MTTTSIFEDMQTPHLHLSNLILVQSFNGGIPVSEVEDEYIQETLQGMDVSCVFVKRDNDYYEFKSEIESKEQIRDFLETDEQAVIGQFETWWDKYKITLHEIDAEVKKSEEVMWDYLKELGYE